MGFFQGIQEHVWNSRGTRAVSVRAMDVLLYMARAEDEHKFWT